MPERRSLPKVLSEFVIIVVGVFVALAADSWYQGWSESRGLEEYLDRLVVDLRSDSATFTGVIETLDRKDAGLEQVAAVALGLEEPDSTFFSSLDITWRQGFNTPSSQRATYEDLITTGNLRLIRDSRLRSLLLDYYAFAENDRRRIEQRRTDYPQAVYRLDPSGWKAPRFEAVYPSLAQSALDSLRSPGFLNLLNAERTLSGFIRLEMRQLVERAVLLLEQVKKAREAV